MNILPKSNYRTFTLVELLVVIVIIGILGSVITASLGSARKQARDAKRVADVKNIAQAIEEYYTDKGAYPVISNGSENTDAGLCIESSTTLQGMLIPTFLAAIPRDPLYNASDCTSDLNTNCHCYIYRTQGATAKNKEFKLFSKAENFTTQGAVSEGGVYYFEAASPTETAAAMTPSPTGSVYGNWFGYSGVAPTFSRTSVAYLSNGTQVASGSARFETIAAGLQGITIEEGTTNVCTNGDFETNVSGWGKYTSDGSGTFVQSSEWSKLGVDSLKAQIGAAGAIDMQYTFAFALNETATLSFWVKPSNTGSVSLYFQDNNDGTYFGAGSTSVTAGVAKYVTVSFQNTHYDGNWHIGINMGTGNGTYFYIDQVQIEKKTYATSFINGTRAPEILTVPTSGVLSLSQGTIEFILNVNSDIRKSDFQHPVTITTGEAGWKNSIIGFHNRVGTRFTFQTFDGLGNSSGINVLDSGITDGLHRFAMRYGSSDFSVFIDGVKKGSVATPYLPSVLASNIQIGQTNSGTYGCIDTQISDFIVSNIARSDADLQARGVLTSLPVDSSTTYKLGLNGSLQ